jgi:hypothetical protein
VRNYLNRQDSLESITLKVSCPQASQTTNSFDTLSLQTSLCGSGQDADKTIKRKGISPAFLNFSPDVFITLSAEEPRANGKFDKPSAV